VPTLSLSQWIAVGAVVAAAAGGWYARGVVADNDMLAYKQGLYDQANDQRILRAKVEAAQTAVTADSTERVNQSQKAQAETVRVVTKEIVRYVQNPDHGKCVLPADFVWGYNRSLGVPGVPETAAP